MAKKIFSTKILFLADSENNLFLDSLKLLKTKSDFDILTTDSESRFREAISTFKPDIIFFDDSLKAFEYKEALNILKKSTSQTLFIMLTENGSNEFGRLILENGVNDYTLKDTPENLLFFIEKTVFKFNLEKERIKSTEISSYIERTIEGLKDTSSDIVTILTTTGEIKFITSSIENVLGFSEKEANNTKLIELLNLDSPNIFSEALNYTISNPKKNSASILIPAKNKKGKTIWLQISFINQLADPTVMGIIVWLKEVTNEKLSDYKNGYNEKTLIKRELEKSEERYKSLFNFNPLPTFVFNEIDFKIVDVNESCCANYGYTKEEFLTMNLRGLRKPEEIKSLIELIEKHKDSNKQFFQSYATHLKKDKSEILVVNNYHRFFIDRIPYIVTVSTNITEKDKILKELTETTEKLKVAEKIAKIGYWELDLNENSLFCSDYIFKIYGMEDTKSEPDLDSFIKMIHPDDRKKYAKEMKDLLSGIKGNEFEFRIVLKNDSIKWLHSRSKLVKNSSGQVYFAKGIIQDITAEKLAFDKLSLSESRYKGLIQSQTNYFVRIGMDGNYSFCNKKFIEEFGWAFPDNNPVGNSSLTDIKKYHHQRLFETTKECMSHPNIICQIELDKRMKNGGTKTTLWEAIYLSGKEDVGEMQCVGIDISERVKVGRENQFQANLLDKIGQGIMATDSEDNVTYWNRAAEEMYQWTKEEVLGKNIFKLLYGDYQDHTEILQLLRTGKSWAGQINAVRKDGSTLPVQITKSPLIDQNGNLSGVIRISSDISSLRKSEIRLTQLNQDLKDYTKELFSANEGLEQFSYIVSHDLRAPIANIIGIGDLLETTNEPEDTYKQLLHELFSNIRRLDDIMQDLNETLKVKTEFPLNLEYVNLENVIQDIIDSNQNLIVKENVRITTDLKETDEIYTVKSYLYNAFYNLISNSIKYRKPDVSPVIEIRTEREDNQTIIYFKDNGLGIDVEKKGDDIFRLYKRFHHHIGGKGLGLFMVKTQLEMLGGQIAVISSVGEGTEFIIHLQNNL